MLNPKVTILAVILNIAGTLDYIIDTFLGLGRPDRVTWAPWSLPPIITFAAQLRMHVGIGCALTAAVGLDAVGALVASFHGGRAPWKVSRSDLSFGAASLLCLAIWALTNNGEIAVVFAILTYVLAPALTAINVYREPHSESKGAFLIANHTYPTYVLLLATVILALAFRPYRMACVPTRPANVGSTA